MLTGLRYEEFSKSLHEAAVRGEVELKRLSRFGFEKSLKYSTVDNKS
jgi:hypothetical protein